MQEPQAKPKNRVTLRDIAQHANVSVSTVSRALNNNPNVDEATRLLVQQAVEELRYSLDNLRRVQDDKPSILLLSRGDFAQETSEFSFGADFERLITQGIRAVLEPNGFDVMLRYTRMQAEDTARLVDTFTADGLILLTGMIDPSFIHALNDARIPFVIAGSHVYPIQTNAVMADNVRGIEQAVDHLVERGRRHIGLVNSSTITKTSEEKLRGLRLGAQKHGLQLADSQTISSLDFNLESGYRQTLQLLNQSSDLDAIIYGHDVMAMGGLRALKERGIRVPDDVAVVGFHDYEIAQFTDPPLTTVAFDTQLMGMMAARRLRMMLDDPDGQNWLMIVPTTLVIRAST
jgi:DNA-binding LacI/PurR family transcriptional regulator